MKYPYIRFIFKPNIRIFMKYIDILLKSNKTVFNFNDIKILLWIWNDNSIKSFFSRWVKQGILVRIYKWIYWFKNYNLNELATKVKKNSYISFETVLKKDWIIFQDYWNTIFLASDDTIDKKLWDINFKYLKIKNDILLNPLWIINKGTYMIATKERAICDRLYLSKNYYFDNLDWVDKDKLLDIAEIYNKRVILEVKNLLKNAK